MKTIILTFITAMVAISGIAQDDLQKIRKDNAEKYFTAFHDGNLEEVYIYLAENCVVQYGTQQPQPAKKFFEMSREMILALKFNTKGIYTSPETNKVLIDFSFTKTNADGGDSKTVDAIDIIEFDNENKIFKISVIPNDNNNS